MVPMVPKVYGVTERLSHRSYATGFRGPVDEIRLTDEDKRFISNVIEGSIDRRDCHFESFRPMGFVILALIDHGIVIEAFINH